MARRLISLAGKVVRKSVADLDADRYLYLSLDQAEPNPGNPDSDNSLFFSDADGTRGFTKKPKLNGLAFDNGKLPEADETRDYALILNTNPTVAGDDSVGYRKLGDLAFTNESEITLQLVTENRNTTTEGIQIQSGPLSGANDNTYGLQINGYNNGSPENAMFIGDNTVSLIEGDLQITGAFNMNTTDGDIRGTGITGLNSIELIVIDSALAEIPYRIGKREFNFTAFDPPTLREVTQFTIGSGDQSSSFAQGASTPDGINAKFLKAFEIQDRTSAAGAYRTNYRRALVVDTVGIGLNQTTADSIGYRNLSDLALYDSTNDDIKMPRLFVREPGIGIISAISGTVPLVFQDSVTKEYKVLDIDVTNLDNTFETLHSVAGRANQDPDLDIGETINPVIFSGQVKLRNNSPGAPLNELTTNTVVVAERATSNDSAVVGIRNASDIAFNDSLVTLDFVVERGDSTDLGITVGSAKVKDLSLNSVVFAGADGQLSDNPNLTFSTATNPPTFTSSGFTQLDSTNVSTELTVTGDAFFSSDIDVDGLSNFDSVKVQLGATFLDDVAVEGDTVLNSTTVNTDLTVSGSLISNGLTILDSTSIDAGAFGNGIEFSNVKPNVNNSTTFLALNGSTVETITISQEAQTVDTLTTVTNPSRPAGYDTTPTPLYLNGGISTIAPPVDIASTYNLLVLQTPSGDSVEYLSVDANILNGTSLGLDEVLTNDPVSGRNIILTGTGGLTADSATLSYLTVSDSATINDLVVLGSLRVEGATTIINSTELTVDDKNIVLADGAQQPSDANAGGITLKTGVDSSVNLFYAVLEDRWVFDHSLKVESDLTVTNDLTVGGLTDLDSTTITGRAGLTLSGLSTDNTSETTSLMLLPTGKVVGRDLAASAFTNPNLQTVTDQDYITTTPIIAKGFKGDSANLSVQLNVTGTATVEKLRITQLVEKPDLLKVLAYQNDSAETTTLENTAHTALTYFTIDQAAETGADQLTRQIDVTQPINLDVGFTAGLNNPGTPAGAFDVVRIADAGGTDSAFRVTLQSGATKPAEDYTWAFVLGNGDSTGGQDVNIGSQLYINRSSLPNAAPFSSSLVVPVFKPTNTGVEFDSVGVRTLGTAANVATEFFTLQEVTNNSNQTIGGVAFAETSRGLKIGNLIASIGEFTGVYAPAGDGKALFISPNAEGGADSVGYRDVGAFAFKDTTNLQEVTTGEASGDSTTASIGVHGLTIRNANDFYVKQDFGSWPSIADVDDAVMWDVDTEQLTVRNLAPSAFEVPSLQDVTTAGDSTNIRSVFAGGIDFDLENTNGLPIITEQNVIDNGVGYYNMLLVQTGGAESGVVKRGSQGVVSRLTERDTLRSVTDRGASLSAVGADSARVPLIFSNYHIKFTALQDSETRDTLVAINPSTGQISRRSVSSINANDTLSAVTGRGNKTALRLGTTGIELQRGTFAGATDTTDNLPQYDLVLSTVGGPNNSTLLSVDQGQFDSDLNVDGLTTLDSTTIDGTLTVRASTPDLTPRVLVVDSAGADTITAAGSGAQLAASGSLVLKGDDPDINMDIDSDSLTADLIETRFRIIGEGGIRNGARITYSKSGKDFTVYGQETGSRLLLGANGSTQNVVIDSASFNVNVASNLDSTAIDAGVNGDGLTIPNLGTEIANTDVLTINGDVVSKTAFSDLYDVPTLQQVTNAGHTTTLEIQALGVRADSATIAGNVEVGNDLTVLGTSANLGRFNYLNHQAEAGNSFIFVRSEQSPVQSHFIAFDSADNGLGDDYTEMRFGVKSISDGSIINQLVLSGQDGPKVTTDYTSTDFTIDNATNGASTASKILFTSGNTSGANAQYSYGEIRTVFTGRTAGDETARMELRVSGTSDLVTPNVRIRIDSDGEVLITDTEKLKLDTGVQLHDAAGLNLVIYDSAGAVLWGNV